VQSFKNAGFMNRSLICKLSFVVSLVITAVAIWLRIANNEDPQSLLRIGSCFTIIFIITAIIEVQRSRHATRSEKTMWTLAFIFFSLLAGIIYFAFARKKLAEAA